MTAPRLTSRRAGLLAAAAFAILACGPAAAEELITAVSSDAVRIESNFTGAEIVLFGSIERDAQTVARRHGYDIVIAVRGPDQEIVARRKSRLAGIWINRESRRYPEAPSYLAILSNRPLGDIADGLVLSRFQLGLKHLTLTEPDAGAASGGGDADMFRDAVVRLMRERAHYFEDPSGVEFLNPSLFKAHIPLPASVPVGKYRAEVYLFGDGAMLARATTDITIRKSGVEQLISVLAAEMPLLYGLAAVLLAIVSGWLAGILFRRD